MAAAGILGDAADVAVRRQGSTRGSKFRAAGVASRRTGRAELAAGDRRADATLTGLVRATGCAIGLRSLDALAIGRAADPIIAGIVLAAAIDSSPRRADAILATISGRAAVVVSVAACPIGFWLLDADAVRLPAHAIVAGVSQCGAILSAGAAARRTAGAATVIDGHAIGHPGPAERGVGHVRIVRDDRVGQVGVDQAGAAQVGLGQIGAAEIGPAQVSARDVASGAVEIAERGRTGQIAAADIRSLAGTTCARSPAIFRLGLRPLLVLSPAVILPSALVVMALVLMTGIVPVSLSAFPFPLLLVLPLVVVLLALRTILGRGVQHDRKWAGR